MLTVAYDKPLPGIVDLEAGLNEKEGTLPTCSNMCPVKIFYI
jgi:hypothetical protein